MTRDALIIIDVQKDFVGGTLAVPFAREILAPVERLAALFDTIVLTQDWHPMEHSSFADNHEGKAPFDTIAMPYGAQTLWPVHCVQDQVGSEFDLAPWIVRKAQMIQRKGFRPALDSYSAFLENDHATPTGLAGWLRDTGVTRLTLCGLATDYCVGFSAIDAADLGFEVRVVLEACRGIARDTIDQRSAEMVAKGVTLL